MEMGRVGDPFSETSIQFAIDRDRIWRVRLALQRGNDAAIDPIMDHPEADAISLANLTNVQGSLGGLWSLNAMFVSQPFYRTRRNRLPCCRAFVAFVAQQGDDFVIVMLDRQLSNAFNERGRITDCNSPLWRQLDASKAG